MDTKLTEMNNFQNFNDHGIIKLAIKKSFWEYRKHAIHTKGFQTVPTKAASWTLVQRLSTISTSLGHLWLGRYFTFFTNYFSVKSIYVTRFGRDKYVVYFVK